MAISDSLRNLADHVKQGRGPAAAAPWNATRGRLNDKPPEEGRNRRESLKLLATMVATYGAPYLIQRAVAASIDFRTDFRELDPLRFWNFLPGGGLDIRPERHLMAAHPKGVNLLKPSERLDDGEVTIRLAPAGTATFLLRAEDDRHGYRVIFQREVGRTGIEVWRLRKGKANYVTHFNLFDGRDNAYSEPWLRFKMDGRYFTASLLDREPSMLDRFAPAPLRPSYRVIHNWIDNHYPRGAVGLAGPARYAFGSGAFRVFSVHVSSRPSQEGETSKEAKRT